MPHALLIAVICIAYFGSMAALLAYIAATGRPRAREEDPDGEDAGRGDAEMRRAA